MRRHLVVASLLIASAAGSIWWLAGSDDGFQSFEGKIFGTSYRLTYFEGKQLTIDTVQIQSAVENELLRIDRIASNWKQDSEISRYNRSDQKQTFPLSPELEFLIQRCREIEALTEGAFKADYVAGKFDLSAIAKGYAVDRIAAYLEEELKIDSFLIEIGGEVKAKGLNPQGKTWTVGVYLPSTHREILPPKVQLKNTSIATSGNYFKGNHIIDPATGTPAGNQLVSTSVINLSNTTADALATALHVMGLEEGPSWARQHNIHSIFILNDGTILEIK